MTGLRIFGIVLAVAGIVGAVVPGWFGPLAGGAPADVFEAIERRVRVGMLLGVGLCFIAIPTLRPWSTSIPTAIFYFVTGALVARVIGLLIEGSVPPKQWLLMAVEAGIMTLVALWLWRAGGSAR